MNSFMFSNDRPIYIQLVEQLELYIVSGKIPPGQRLPSVRDLAISAKVNPNTMQRALAELESLKLIYTERTNGKFVTTNEKLLTKYRNKLATEKAKIYFQSMQKLGFDKNNALEFLKQKGGTK